MATGVRANWMFRWDGGKFIFPLCLFWFLYAWNFEKLYFLSPCLFEGHSLNKIFEDHRHLFFCLNDRFCSQAVNFNGGHKKTEEKSAQIPNQQRDILIQSKHLSKIAQSLRIMTQASEGQKKLLERLSNENVKDERANQSDHGACFGRWRSL